MSDLVCASLADLTGPQKPLIERRCVNFTTGLPEYRSAALAQLPKRWTTEELEERLEALEARSAAVDRSLESLGLDVS